MVLKATHDAAPANTSAPKIGDNRRFMLQRGKSPNVTWSTREYMSHPRPRKLCAATIFSGVGNREALTIHREPPYNRPGAALPCRKPTTSGRGRVLHHEEPHCASRKSAAPRPYSDTRPVVRPQGGARRQQPRPTSASQRTWSSVLTS